MNIPRRIMLPIGHLMVDCAVLLHWLWIGSAWRYSKVSDLPGHARIVLCQEGGAEVAFDPQFMRPLREFLFITGGNVPAMILSTSLRSEGQITPRKQPWDPVWFAMHEAISFLLWFGIGELLDCGILGTSRLLVGYLLVGYLLARICLAASILTGEIGDLAWKFEVTFWLVFALYVVAASLRFAASRLPVRGAGGT